MTAAETSNMVEMLGICEHPPTVELEATGDVVVVPGRHEPTPGPEGTVYSPCEEAAAAGEQRAQGSRGGGKGFPATMIPSVRDGDGDGDGIVCER